MHYRLKYQGYVAIWPKFCMSLIIYLVHKLKYQKSKYRFVIFAKHVIESAMLFFVGKARLTTWSVKKQYMEIYGNSTIITFGWWGGYSLLFQFDCCRTFRIESSLWIQLILVLTIFPSKEKLNFILLHQHLSMFPSDEYLSRLFI